MNNLDFFDTIPTIIMHDPLAQTLGVGDGRFVYAYIDAVKFAGHSCPTVAGAWLCCERALKELYVDETPIRGMIQVEVSESEEEGVAGVIGSIFTLITGAATKGGFKGLQGNFSRNNKLLFNSALASQMKVTRLDSQKSVLLDYNPSSIPVKPEQQKLLKKLMAKEATSQEIERFGLLWQERAAQIFLDADNVVRLSKGE